MTLTTADPADSRRAEKFRRSFEKVCRALRRRWPALEYCSMIEFTTGTSARSGGHRRMHVHVLLRGLGGADLEAVLAVARQVWCERMRAHPAAQDIRPVEGMEGLAHYLAHHHRKPGQQPPEWWTGKRTRSSRGWWSRPIAELRQEAREQLRQERLHYVAQRVAVERLREYCQAHQAPPPEILSGGWDAWVGRVFDALEREREEGPPWVLWHLGADQDGQPRPWMPVPRE